MRYLVNIYIIFIKTVLFYSLSAPKSQLSETAAVRREFVQTVVGIQHAERRFDAALPVGAEYDGRFARREFAEHLAACTAGADRIIGSGRCDRDRDKSAHALRSGGKNRAALGAVREPERAVFDIRSGDDFSVFREQGGSDGKMRIGNVRML